jgi:hypothetical protein
MNANTMVYQFKITLLDILPPIWRRIQVPCKYYFWDLHVAIQDSMGWLDYHLHVFRFRGSHKNDGIEIGIPNDEMNDNIQDNVILPGWEIKISEYLTEPGSSMLYEYDFGDSWEHELLLEDISPKTIDTKYPRCLAGERACPPEDCGSVPGYYRLLEILKDPKHKEYKETNDWLKGHAKNYYPYHPDEFKPDKVHFDNPSKRLKNAFSA